MGVPEIITIALVVLVFVGAEILLCRVTGVSRQSKASPKQS